MGTNGKTIKEIAEEIGVSKQAVQKRISREPLYTSIQPYISTVGGTKYIAYIGENLIKSTFSENDRQPVTDNQPTTLYIPVDSDVYSVLKETIDTLKLQLEVKDNQLAEKDKQIGELTATVKAQAESINADRHNQLAETLIDGKQLIEGRSEPIEQDIKFLKEHCMKTDEKIMQIKERLAETKEHPEIKKGLFSRIFGN